MVCPCCGNYIIELHYGIFLSQWHRITLYTRKDYIVYFASLPYTKVWRITVWMFSFSVVGCFFFFSYLFFPLIPITYTPNHPHPPFLFLSSTCSCQTPLWDAMHTCMEWASTAALCLSASNIIKQAASTQPTTPSASTHTLLQVSEVKPEQSPCSFLHWIGLLVLHGWTFVYAMLTLAITGHRR